MNFNELNSNITHWTSEEEELLIMKIKGYCDKYKGNCEMLEKNIKQVEENIEIINVELLNGVNGLKKLALDKYTVFEISNEEKKEAKRNDPVVNNKKEVFIGNKEERERNMMMRYNKAIEISVDGLRIRNGNKEEEKKSEVKLPCLIGTKEFFGSETLGIIDDTINMNDNQRIENDIKGEDRRKNSVKNENVSQNKGSLMNAESIRSIDNMMIKKTNNLFDNEEKEESKVSVIKQVYNDDIEDRLLFFNQFESSAQLKKTIENNIITKADDTKKPQPQISIDQYIKKGIFDDIDEEDIKPAISKPKTTIDIGLFIDAKERKEEDVIKGPSPILPIKPVKEVNKHHKENNSQLESAKERLFQIFNEDEDELDNDETNNIKIIEDKTNAISNKLHMITGEKENNPVIMVITPPTKSVPKDNNEISYIKKEESKIEKKKTFNFDEDDDSLSNQMISNIKTEIKLSNFLKETNDKLPKKTPGKLDFMFEEDEEDKELKRLDEEKKIQSISLINTKPLIEDNKTQSKPIISNNTQKKNDLSAKLSKLFEDDEFQEKPLEKKQSFEQMKSLLNQKFSTSIPHNLTNQDTIITSTQSESHENKQINQNNTIDLLMNNNTTIKKKKPQKPLFKNNPIPQSSPFKSQFIPNAKSSQPSSNAISKPPITKDSTTKPKLIKFTFDSDDE